MKELTLPKPISGNRLVEILNTAGPRCGFRIDKSKPDDNGYSDYTATTNTRPQAFDYPDFLMTFVKIRPGDNYTNVNYMTQASGIHTGGRQEIDVDKTFEEKWTHDELIKEIIKYSTE